MPSQNLTEIAAHRSRIKSLDALRGFAAIGVIVAHSVPVYLRWVDVSPLYLLSAAHEGVLFFFLLSGFVLVYQTKGDISQRAYFDLLLSRFFRLYLPYIAAMLICWAVIPLALPMRQGDTWLASIPWDTELTPSLFFGHLFLIKDFETSTYNPAVWTLIHEVRVSLLFPLLLLVLRMRPVYAILLGLAVFFVSAYVLLYHNPPGKGFSSTWIYTCYYSILFLAGGIVAKHLDQISQWYSGLSSRTVVAYLIVALSLYTFIHKLPYQFNRFHIGGYEQFSFIIQDLAVVIGASYIIIFCIFLKKETNILVNKVTLFLGKISYSMYLLHVIVLKLVYQWIGFEHSVLLFLCVSYGLIVIVSALFDRFVELPLIKLGKQIRTKMIPATPKHR